MADGYFNSTTQLPDAHYEVEIEAVVPSEIDNAVLDRNVADAVRSMGVKMKITPRRTRPFIYRVNKTLREVNEKAYEPVMLAIGPYHRGKDSLKMAEEQKWRFLKTLLHRRSDVKFEDYISAVAKMEQMARDCYEEPVDHISSAEFIEMLVLDWCFIIEIMQRCTPRYSAYNVGDPVFQNLWILHVLTEDMMLFENQIPFFVLCKLFDLIDAPNQHDRFIYLVQFFFRDYFPGRISTNSSSTSHDGKLFDRISGFIKKRIPGAGTSSSSSKEEHDLLHNYEKSENQNILHILDLLHSNWSRTSNNGDVKTPVEEGFQFIRSATDLRDANVKFRISSEHSTMFDIVFNKGTLSIPPLWISDTTESILRNLIVYEQFFPFKRPTTFTDFARFLDCLINSSADVTLLSECGIIHNWMGDNEAVAKIFNEISISTCLTLHFAFANTFHLINTHYKRKKNRAIAKLRRNYFNSPWAYISFFAGLLLLSLTIAQTVLSALQLG